MLQKMLYFLKNKLHNQSNILILCKREPKNVSNFVCQLSKNLTHEMVRLQVLPFETKNCKKINEKTLTCVETIIVVDFLVPCTTWPCSSCRLKRRCRSKRGRRRCVCCLPGCWCGGYRAGSIFVHQNNLENKTVAINHSQDEKEIETSTTLELEETDISGHLVNFLLIGIDLLISQTDLTKLNYFRESTIEDWAKLN